MPSPALALLNHHLDPLVRLNGKMYPKSKVDRVYAKLSTPKLPFINKNEPNRFYEGDRAIGYINNSGEYARVDFITEWPELAALSNSDATWSYRSPEELGIERTSPAPTRDLIKMKRAWVERTRMPDGSIRPSGSGLYTNTPLSNHRSDAYLNADFINVDTGNIYNRLQVADLRRGQTNPTLAELYSYKDAEILKQEMAKALLLNREAKLPMLASQIRVAANQGSLGTTFAPPTPLPLAPSTNWVGGGVNGSYGYRDW